MLSFIGNLDDTTSGLYESRHGGKERDGWVGGWGGGKFMIINEEK